MMSRAGLEPARACPRRSRRRASADSATWTEPRDTVAKAGTVRSSVSRFRAWRPAGWTIPQRGCPPRRPTRSVERQTSSALRPPSSAKVDAAPSVLAPPFRYVLSCSSHSPTLRPWIEQTPFGDLPSYVEELWSPAPLHPSENCRRKPTGNTASLFTAQQHRGTFLSQAGPRALLGFLKLSITSLNSVIDPETTKATSLGRPRKSRTVASKLHLCASNESGHEPGRALIRAERLFARRPQTNRHDGGAIRVDVKVSGH